MTPASGSLRLTPISASNWLPGIRSFSTAQFTLTLIGKSGGLAWTAFPGLPVTSRAAARHTVTVRASMNDSLRSVKIGCLRGPAGNGRPLRLIALRLSEKGSDPLNLGRGFPEIPGGLTPFRTATLIEMRRTAADRQDGKRLAVSGPDRTTRGGGYSRRGPASRATAWAAGAGRWPAARS